MEYKIDELLNRGRNSTMIDGKWVEARPMEYQGIGKWKYRIKEAVLVLTGKADIMTWHKQ